MVRAVNNSISKITSHPYLPNKGSGKALIANQELSKLPKLVQPIPKNAAQKSGNQLADLGIEDEDAYFWDPEAEQFIRKDGDQYSASTIQEISNIREEAMASIHCITNHVHIKKTKEWTNLYNQSVQAESQK